MARAHPEQHIPIQLTLHRDHPLFRFLESERGRLGHSRAGYLRWLLEQQLLRSEAERGSVAGGVSPTVITPVLATTTTTQAEALSGEPELEPDADLLASFLS
jgi:hypothetical protein